MPYSRSSDLNGILSRMREFIDEEVIPAEPVLRDMTLDSLVEMERLKGEAKHRGLWALGHPEEIGGGGLGFAPGGLRRARHRHR